MKPHRRHIATLVVATHGNRILLLRRRKDPNRGLWSPPGGKLEAGETPLAGAGREFMEETGLHPQGLHLAAVVSEVDVASGDEWLMFVFGARATGEPVGDPSEGVPRWVPMADVARLPKPPADDQILAAALSGPPGIAFLAVTFDGGRLVGVRRQVNRPGEARQPADPDAPEATGHLTS